MTRTRSPVARHAAAPSGSLRIFVPIGLVVTLLGVVWSLLGGGSATGSAAASGSMMLTAPRPVIPATASELPGVSVQAVQISAPCEQAHVQAALASGDDEAVVAGFGGGAALRAAVVAGAAPCIDLADPSRVWLVVNKQRALEPVEYAPATLATPASTRADASPVRADVAAALDAMSAATQAQGLGTLALGSGFRSYGVQVGNYDAHIAEFGQASADAVSARPGHSEHQTGLAADVVSCTDGCGGIYDFGGSAAGQWVAQNGWQYGFVVRYESGLTATTGYDPEPWHLRYIGPALAKAYHDGGYRSLEHFFGLPDAPDYAF